ncbi:MAG: hypothetical protein ACREJT_04205 [Myxococcota bacterium]
MTESLERFARLLPDPGIEIRFEDLKQRRLDADGEGLPVRLAIAAAERVDGMAANLGDGVTELAEDGFDVRLVREMKIDDCPVAPPRIRRGIDLLARLAHR